MSPEFTAKEPGHVEPVAVRHPHLQPRHLALGEKRHEVGVGVRGDAELVRFRRHGRVVREPEAELALPESMVEGVRGQVEGHRAERQEFLREGVHGAGVGEDPLAKVGQVLWPLIGPSETPAGADERVVGATLALDEERLVQVGLVVGVDVRGPDRVAPQHHVAVVVLVHAQSELGVHGLGVEAPGFGEGGVHERLRNAVIHHDEEADVLERPPKLGGHGGGGAWASGEIRSEIQHGNHDA